MARHAFHWLAFYAIINSGILQFVQALDPQQPATLSAPLITGLYTTAPPELTSANAAAAHAPRRLCAPSTAAGDGGAWRCRNWAGTVEWTPEAVVLPESEEALSAFLRSEAAASTSTSAVDAAEAAADPTASAAALPAAPVRRPRRSFRVVGFAHSWAGIFVPAAGNGTTSGTTTSSGTGSGVTIALHQLSGITKIIPPPAAPAAPGGAAAIGYVEALAGTSFATLFQALDAVGLALLVPPGGIQGLTVGGAVSVGFHGSQSTLGGASSGVVAMRVVDANGIPHDLSEGTHPEAMRATRLALGMCGVVTRVTMPVTQQFHLLRRRWRVDGAEAFLDGQMASLKERYDRFHYYIHPATDTAWPMYWEPTTPEASAAEGRPCRTALEQFEDAEEKEFGPDGLPLIMRWDNCSDASHRSLTHAVDMEAQPLWNGELYLPLPADPTAAAAAEAEAVKVLLRRFEALAAAGGGAGGSSRVHPDLWLHVRYVAGDTASYLNPCYGAPVCAAIELALVAHSMNDPLPAWEAWDPYFSAMQEALLPLGSRPHAAKFHSIDPARLLEPAFGLPAEKFAAECRKFDPERLMRDERLGALLGLP